MTDTTLDYGKEAWALKLCTVTPTTDTEAGADWGTGGKAGNYIGILCQPRQISFGVDFLDKTRPGAGGYVFLTPGGKRQFLVEGTGALVKGAESGNSADVISNANKLTTWITTRQESGDVIYYLILRVNGKSAVFYERTTAHYYCGVHCERLRVIGSTRGHALLQFRFVEAWSPT